MKIDMHIHTSASDGTWSSEELAGKIRENGIGVFSITDHDTINASEEMKNLFKINNILDIAFIPGVEVATSYGGKEYHLTVYGYEGNVEFINLLNWNSQQRLNYNYNFIEMKEKIYSNILLSEYFNLYKEKNKTGGWKALNYFLDKGIYSSMADYFQDLKNTDLKIEFKPPEEVVNICLRNSKKVFLAHPSYYYEDNLMSEEELNYWKNAGISGIECYSPYNKNGKQVDYYLDYCRRNDLLISGGSDCHGEFLERKIGYPEIFFENLQLGDLLFTEKNKGECFGY